MTRKGIFSTKFQVKLHPITFFMVLKKQDTCICVNYIMCVGPIYREINNFALREGSHSIIPRTKYGGMERLRKTLRKQNYLKGLHKLFDKSEKRNKENTLNFSCPWDIKVEMSLKGCSLCHGLLQQSGEGCKSIFRIFKNANNKMHTITKETNQTEIIIKRTKKEKVIYMSYRCLEMQIKNSQVRGQAQMSGNKGWVFIFWNREDD